MWFTGRMKMKDHTIRAGESFRAIAAPKDFRAVVKITKQKIRELKLNYSAIAFRGVSGAMLAGPLCAALGKYPLLVRKPGDGSHSPYKLEGPIGAFGYIIVDDLAYTGDTVLKIVAGINADNSAARCVGIVLYGQKHYPLRDCLKHLPVHANIGITWITNQTTNT